MSVAPGHLVGAFTVAEYPYAINIRVFREDGESEYDLKGPTWGEWMWAEADAQGRYLEHDDEPYPVAIDHTDIEDAFGEMAVIALREIAERKTP